MEKEGTKQIGILDAKQLEKLQAFESFMKEAKTALGDLLLGYEAQKAAILNQVAIEQQKFATLEKEIKEEHGNIQVNIETGEILEQGNQ